MDFRSYIRNRQPTGRAADDFAADARRDPDFPNPTNWPQLEAYLKKHKAAPGVIEAARLSWVEYQASRIRRRD